MVFVAYIHVLSAAFLMGLAAAAPMGPVNMLAIRRGVIGGWRHTLACGIGSITGDLILFSLVLFGGHYLFSDLSNTTLQTVLAAIGVIVMLPLGIYFLVRAVKEPLRAYASARQRWDESTVPAHLAAEVSDATALTIFNPLTIVYWVGVTSNWLPFAHSVLGYRAPGLGILMATAGLMTWFTALTLAVRFIPRRIRPNFFRLVNAFLGLILLGFATFCAIALSRHLLHCPRSPPYTVELTARKSELCPIAFGMILLGRGVYHFSPPYNLARQENPPIQGWQVLLQEHVDFATPHSTYRCSKGRALLESPMTSQYTLYPSRKSIARAALVGLGLNGATGPLRHLLCAIVSKAVGILPSVLLVAWQEALASAVAHPRLLELLSHWVTFLSLLETLGRLR